MSVDVPAIQTVQRAAAILGAFTPERPRLSLGEITAELGMSKATAHRYARALRAANLLRYDPVAARYTLGPQILALEAAARAGLPIVTAAEPYLDELMRETDLTAVLSVWNGDGPTVVRCADNTVGDVRISVRTGSQLDLTRSAQGRIFCAYLPAAEAPGIARRLKSSADLRKVVEEVRREGIAANSPEDFGVRVLAAPVFERTNVVAAIAVVGTSVRLSGAEEVAAAATLRRIAARLSQELGAE
ncbi:IclR family transcriptional regulator [Phytohabitans rumicis]|nr:IclR family transcriptional regulator [Phytohabitans rumicis]